ncbi:MAG: TolC family protein [bacterium]
MISNQSFSILRRRALYTSLFQLGILFSLSIPLVLLHLSPFLIPIRPAWARIAYAENTEPSHIECREESSEDKKLAITIKEAIFMTLENNHSLTIERMNPAIQRTFEDQERAAFDPVVSGEVSRSQEKAGNTDEGSMEGSVEISKFFSTGTKMSAGLSSDRTWSDLYGDQHETRAGLTITQALLKGAGIEINSATLRQAQLDTFASQYELRGFAEYLISEVESTYWDYALAEERIKIFIESLNLAKQQMKETEERIKVGVLSEIELAAAQAEVALRKEDLINAKGDCAKARLHLLRLLNPKTNPWEREVLLVDEPAVPAIQLDDVDSHVEVGLRMRTDLNQARMNLQKGDIEVVKTKNGLLPKMDFFITLGTSGYSDSFGNSIKDFEGKDYDIMAGITMEYPLRNRNAHSRHTRATLNRIKADEALKNLAQLVQMDIRSAYIEVTRSSEQVIATAATRALQEEKMRAETEKFRVGKSTSLLVAQTQRDLIASRISQIESIVEYLKAFVELYRLEGSLLERRGISLTEYELSRPTQH